MNNLNHMLTQMVENNASDMHLTVGSPIRMRINGELKELNDIKLSANNIRNILKEHLNNHRLERLNNGQDIDNLSLLDYNLGLTLSNIVHTEVYNLQIYKNHHLYNPL